MLDEQIKQDTIAAMKSRDEVAKQALRMLSAALKNEAIAQKSALTDEQELAVLSREVKRLREGAEEFRAAGRDDLADAAEKELKIYEQYLPEQMSDEKLETIIRETIADVDASSMADIGRVMSAAMPKVKGQADGNRVRSIAQVLLGT